MTSGQGKNGCNSSGGIMAAIQFHGREMKKAQTEVRTLFYIIGAEKQLKLSKVR